MSISVHSTSINIPLSGYSYFFGTLYNNAEVYPKSIPFYESFSTMHHFATFSTMPCLSDHNQLTDHSKYRATDWLNQVCPDTARKNSVHENMNFDSQENVPNPSDFNSQENNQSKSKIWRPFSPPPSSQMDIAVESTVHRRNTRTANRNTFFSIKPSNVKIGLSKTSVFKAVKKNIFACTQCPSRYLSNRQLNSHMRVHTGSKPFRCEYPNCFKSFARNEELTRHKRIHSGFKPHLCTICRKRFGRKDHLSKHLKTHLQTSEKKVYQCSFPGCGHRYTRSDALTRHKSTAHAIKNQK